MDDRRFDQLAKAIAGEAGSRRKALGLAAGGALAAVLGFLGVAETTEARHTRRHGDRDSRSRREKTRTICHCRDDTGNNCQTKRLPAKKAKRHLRQHPDDFKGKCDRASNACTDVNVPCLTTQGAQCCAGTCCFDIRNNVPSGGVCPPRDANCCGANQSGGYCTSSFPECCGEEACCRSGEVCCATIARPAGYCCPAGNTCDLESPSGCRAAQAATQIASESVGTFEPRGRVGN